MLMIFGAGLSLYGLVITDCEISNFNDDCMPIEDPRVLTLTLVGVFSTLLGIIAIPICEIRKLLLEKK